MTETHIKLDRIGRKERRNLTLSPDLVGVVDELVGKTERSAYAERAMWRLLVEEHGAETVEETLEEVQDGLGPDDRLGVPREIQLRA